MLRIFIILSAVFVASAAAATQLYVNAPKDGFLNLRMGPSTAYNVLTEMPHGSLVELLAAPGKWVKLRDSQGYTGWAHSNYLSTTPVLKPEPAPQVMYVYAPKHGALNLRHGPSTSYDVITKMAHGSKLLVLGAHGKWRLIEHESGFVGWAHNAYLSLTKHVVVPYAHQHVPHATPPVSRGSAWIHSLRRCAHKPAHVKQRCMMRQLGKLQY